MSARVVNDHGYEAYLREDKLMGCRCQSCQALFVPPRTICTSCHGTDMFWEEVSGAGRLAAFTAIAIGPAFMAEEGYGRDNPYITGVVELDEGAKLRDGRGSRAGFRRRNDKLRDDLVACFVRAVALDVVAKAQRCRPLADERLAGANVSRRPQPATAARDG